MHDVKNALPSGKARESFRKLPVVSESIIRGLQLGLLHISGGGAGEREVDDERAGNNGLAGNEAPEPRVLAVIAIVAEDKVLTRRDRELSTCG